MLVKCKMCGGDMQLSHIENLTVCTCEYCGSKITLPNLDDEQKIFRYNRGNQYRLQNDYDGARQQFDSLLNYSKDDSEIYWSILLCDYGIEYVKDPQTKKRIPTCHRTIASPITKNPNYISAIKFASSDEARELYQQEAAEIDRLQKDILSISQTVDPYDIFICYKESDDNGARTIDSVIAQELYDKLQQDHYRVFFSRQTLKTVPGTTYEPYIYAALESSKVMIVIGSQRKFLESPWVKNEWNRFLAQIQRGAKKLLIPAYKGMSPYDLPDELGPFQAQDLNTLGYYQDLIAGINRFLGKEKREPAANIYGYLEVGFQNLSMGDKSKALTFFETANTLEPNSSLPYLGLLITDAPSKQEFFYQKFSSLFSPEEKEKEIHYLTLCKQFIAEYFTLFLRFEDDERAKECLQIPNANFNVEINGYLPICYAIDKQNIEVVKTLCYHPSVDLNALCSDQTISPLGLACQKKNEDLIDLLLEAGAAPNISYKMPNSKNRMLPLGTCIDKGFVTGVKKLMEHGASVNTEYDPYGLPLAHAIQMGQLQICDILLEHGAKINQTSRGIPVFMNMIYAKDSSMVAYCHDHGADFNIQIPYGDKTVDLIYYVAYENRTKYLKEIIYHVGADIYFSDMKHLRNKIYKKRIIFTILSIIVFVIIFRLLYSFFDMVSAFNDRKTGETNPLGIPVVLTLSGIISGFPINFFKKIILWDESYENTLSMYQLLHPYWNEAKIYGKDN